VSPGYQTFANLAEFDLKLNICPIPFLGMEGIVQLNHAVIPRIEAVMDERRALNPTRRFGTPAEFGAVCAFLCSVHAGYITGQNILLDGGAYPGTL
jgi:NAD(P)-dependent dehydrogenase (short-subunit alcohol dehydrogenase family)